MDRNIQKRKSANGSDIGSRSPLNFNVKLQNSPVNFSNCLLIENDNDIICITETWLIENVPDNAFS